MPAPTQPLGKIYTLKMARNLIIQWLKQEQQQDLDPDLVEGFLALAILDVAEIISGAGSDDYGKSADVTDAAGSTTTTLVAGSTYTHATRTVNKTAHGYTSADIGKRIAMWSGSRAGVSWIESITDVDSFVTKQSFGANASIDFAVFPAHAETSIDLSSYKIANITKLVSSTVKEVVKVGDKQFDNLHRFEEKQNKVFYYKHGQYLFLYIGTDVSSAGTLTMYYNSYPQRVVGSDNDNEFLDIRDNYSALYIAKAKNYCLEHLNIAAPESLTNLIDSKSKEARDNILREKGIIEQKNLKATPH
jgi:hypothetical protein